MEAFIEKEGGVRQDCTALEPEVLGSNPFLPLIEYLTVQGAFCSLLQILATTPIGWSSL